MPPSAPERTLQASGQGQAIARPKGGPPCCSVPVPSTRWVPSGASPPLKTSYVCLYQDKLTHAHVRVRVKPNEIPGGRNPEESRLPARANHKTFANGSKHHRSCLAHASNFFLLYALREEGHAPRLRSRPERASDMDPQAPFTCCFASPVPIYRWRAASTEAFALNVIVAGLGRAPKTLPSARISLHEVTFCASREPTNRANS
jgi:hypothetical protein